MLKRNSYILTILIHNIQPRTKLYSCNCFLVVILNIYIFSRFVILFRNTHRCIPQKLLQQPLSPLFYFQLTQAEIAGRDRKISDCSGKGYTWLLDEKSLSIIVGHYSIPVCCLNLSSKSSKENSQELELTQFSPRSHPNISWEKGQHKIKHHPRHYQ